MPHNSVKEEATPVIHRRVATTCYAGCMEAIPYGDGKMLSAKESRRLRALSSHIVPSPGRRTPTVGRSERMFVSSGPFNGLSLHTLCLHENRLACRAKPSTYFSHSLAFSLSARGPP